MNPLLQGRWISDNAKTFCPYKLLIRVDAINVVKVAKYKGRKWDAYPFTLEMVGNQIQYKGNVICVVTSVTENEIAIYTREDNRTIYLKRLPSPCLPS